MRRREQCGLPALPEQNLPTEIAEPMSNGSAATAANLRETVAQVVSEYLEQMDDDAAINDLYELVIQEVEASLLAVVLDHTSSNQSKASMLLGLNRGTLRKKMKHHGLL